MNKTTYLMHKFFMTVIKNKYTHNKNLNNNKKQEVCIIFFIKYNKI